MCADRLLISTKGKATMPDVRPVRVRLAVVVEVTFGHEWTEAHTLEEITKAAVSSARHRFTEALGLRAGVTIAEVKPISATLSLNGAFPP